ncbi:MAG: helix-turn-helix domain-containing protein, partial [Gimesia sp.]|nr:helix-turn-helix domain-containing protein [Gimesia sp.]
EKVFQNPESIIPAHQVWGFIGSAAQKEGIDDLGLVAGDMSIQDYGAFSERLLQAPNLNQALKVFCQIALHEYSRADFYISRSEQATWFCRGPIDGNEDEKKHVELLVLTMMIATVRLVAGSDWYPSIIFLQSKNPCGVEQHHLLSQSTVRFGNRVTAFEVPQYLLPKQLPNSVFPIKDQCYSNLEHEFHIAIHQIVEDMLVDNTPKIELVAEAVGTSVRTLQRRLSEINITFSDVLEKVRLKKAKQLITQSGVMLNDIAFELGYSDQAHFTRAFRRWTGISPGTYQSQQSLASEKSK